MHEHDRTPDAGRPVSDLGAVWRRDFACYLACHPSFPSCLGSMVEHNASCVKRPVMARFRGNVDDWRAGDVTPTGSAGWGPARILASASTAVAAATRNRATGTARNRATGMVGR